MNITRIKSSRGIPKGNTEIIVKLEECGGRTVAVEFGDGVVDKLKIIVRSVPSSVFKPKNPARAVKGFDGCRIGRIPPVILLCEIFKQVVFRRKNNIKPHLPRIPHFGQDERKTHTNSHGHRRDAIGPKGCYEQ